MWSFLFRALHAARLRLTPPVPDRFDDLIQLFRRAYPDADAGAWEAFAHELATGAYWEGERRGYDRARGLDEEALAKRHDWTAPGSHCPALLEPVPGGTREEIEQVRALIHAANDAGVPIEVRRAGE